MMIDLSFSRIECALAVMNAYGFDNELDQDMFIRAVEGKAVQVSRLEIERKNSATEIREMIERKLLRALTDE